MTSQSLVFLWGVPRSVSTAFEKAVSQHPLISAEHEPFTDSYYFSSERKSDRYESMLDPKPPFRIDGERIIKKKKGASIAFIKDLAFQAEPFVSDKNLLEMRNCFIVRSPRDVYRSLVQLKPDFSEDEFGFTALDRVSKRMRKLGTAPIMVVEGKCFRNNSEEVLREFCRRIEIDFCKEMLVWESGHVREWKEGEEMTHAIWHKTLEHSQGILASEHHPEIIVRPHHREILDHAEEIFLNLTSP